MQKNSKPTSVGHFLVLGSFGTVNNTFGTLEILAFEFLSWFSLLFTLLASYNGKHSLARNPSEVCMCFNLA